MFQRLLHRLYSVLIYFTLPVFFLHLLVGARHNRGYLHHLPERFGLTPRARHESACIWVHAVSVGEVQASIPMIHRLKHRYPDRAILLTTTTPAGAQTARQQLGSTVRHSYVPWDLPGATERFLERAQPAAALILETELWPNLFRACRQRNIPLLLVNARRSERSTRHYLWVRPLIGQALNQTDRILACGPADAQRFLTLGASKSRIRITGNIKFDYQVPACLVRQGQALRQSMSGRPVWLAACTHAGEEQLLLKAHQCLRTSNPGLLLILVPRHPTRCEAIAALCASHSMLTVRRSSRQTITAETAILLGDGMGELPLFYAMSEIAFIGGTLVASGGHSPIEAGAQGLALIVGPYTEKHTDTLTLFLKANAINRVTDSTNLIQTLQHLLRSPAHRRRQGENARTLINACQGGSERAVHELGTLLPH